MTSPIPKTRRSVNPLNTCGSALLGLALLALIACGGDDSAETPASETPAASAAASTAEAPEEGTVVPENPPDARGANAPAEGDGESPAIDAIDQSTSESVTGTADPESVGAVPTEGGGG